MHNLEYPAHQEVHPLAIADRGVAFRVGSQHIAQFADQRLGFRDLQLVEGTTKVEFDLREAGVRVVQGGLLQILVVVFVFRQSHKGCCPTCSKPEILAILLWYTFLAN